MLTGLVVSWMVLTTICVLGVWVGPASCSRYEGVCQGTVSLLVWNYQWTSQGPLDNNPNPNPPSLLYALDNNNNTKLWLYIAVHLAGYL